MIDSGLARRARRALERQLAYQQRKAERVTGHEQPVIASMIRRSATVGEKLERYGANIAEARALEVGSGAHGLIFYFDAAEKVGVDPLAGEYARLFPAWQGRARTVTAFGESLPFGNEEFDIVLCDNVVDHAESPRRIVEEIARVLKPGGLLYFTVNVHHPFYHAAASAHATWRAIGIPLEVTPFADHTVHLTLSSARRLFDALPLAVLHEADSIKQTKREGRTLPPRHAGDRLKRLFFKNALWEMIAAKQPIDG